MKKKPNSPPKCGTFMGIKGVQLSETEHKFWQDVDSDQSSDDICQTLTLKTINAGGGAYIVMETTRWAIDPEDIDAFADCLKRICNTPEADA